FLAVAAQAEYPDKPVHIIAGQGPGGGTDALARLVATKLSEKWGQPVIVENKPGSSTVLAETYVAHAAPDGYTLMMASSDHTIIASQFKLTYDPIKDFAPVSLLTSEPYVVAVNPNYSHINSFQELVAYAKANPGKLNIGTGGARSFVEYVLLSQ